MKQAQCARCGAPVTVPDDFDVFEDMAACVVCDAYLASLDEEVVW